MFRLPLFTSAQLFRFGPIKISSLILDCTARSLPDVETTCQRIHFRKAVVAEYLCRPGTRTFVGSGAVDNYGESGRDLVQVLLYLLGRYSPSVRQFDIRRFPSLGIARIDKNKPLSLV